MNEAISVLAGICLPGPVLRRALRVALLDPQAVSAEWRSWQTDASPPAVALRNPALRLRRLIPLIEAGLRRSGVELERPLRAFLRMGAAHEKMRRDALVPAAREALTALRTRDIDFLVLRGMALACSVYPQPSMRHCHDLDLLVHDGRADSAARCLADAGFTPATAPPGSDAESRWMVHGCGFPIGVHTRLVRLSPWNQPSTAFPESREATVVGLRARTMAPPEMLAAICVHAATVGSVHSPCWVTDAMYLLAAHPDMDWARVCDAGPALPLWLTLDWLRRELSAPVDPAALRRLGERVEKLDADGVRQAIAAAMLCARGRPGDLLRSARSAGTGLSWIRRLAVPDNQILRWTEHSEGPAALLHFRRLRRFLNGKGGR